MIRISSRRSTLLLLSCLLCFSGCGSAVSLERAAVSGVVTLNGKPLEDGVIRFVPSEGTAGPKQSVPVVHGRFEAEVSEGPVVGTHRIEIESLDTGGFEMDDEDAIDQLRAKRQRRISVEKVPEKYNSRSVLTAEISAGGPNELAFELSSRK